MPLSCEGIVDLLHVTILSTQDNQLKVPGYLELDGNRLGLVKKVRIKKT
jgi:hypothetical protein